MAENEIRQLQNLYNVLIEFFVNYSFQLFGAILIFIIGIIISKRIAKFVQILCERHKIDITLSRFLANISRIFLLAFVIILVLNNLGISITPFIAAVGALSLGAGLAVQGLLSNYSAGLTIIVSRPFILGDTIQVQQVTGIVKDIRLAYTLLVDEDEVEIMIPNRYIVGEIIHNSQSDSLIESQIGVAYGSDLNIIFSAVINLLKSSDLVSKKRDPQVGVGNFGESSIDIHIRYWVSTDKKNQARLLINKDIYECLIKLDIQIPFPQREIKIIKE